MITDNIIAFIFDLDGTLLDSMSIWDDVYKKLFSENNIAMPEGYTIAVNHMDMLSAARYTSLNSDIGLTTQQITDRWRSLAMQSYANEINLKPYAHELIKTLAQNNYLLAIATATDKELFIPCLKKNGIASFFHSATTTQEVHKGKNNPDIYLKECEKLGLLPHQCVVVEDSHVGIKSAKLAGFKTIGIYDEYSSALQKELERYSDWYVKSLSEVLDKIN